MDARFGDASSLLRKLPCALAIAVHASPPDVTADKLLSADDFELRHPFCP